jgi:Putative restriction endonuclease
VVRAAPSEEWPRTVAEFEAWHARRPERWEFIDGRPRLMAPGSLNHTIIKTNADFALREALQRHGTALIGPQDRLSAPARSSISSIRFSRSSSSKRPARSNAAWACDQR